jgi:hypothetical protein
VLIGETTWNDRGRVVEIRVERRVGPMPPTQADGHIWEWRKECRRRAEAARPPVVVPLPDPEYERLRDEFYAD